MKRFGLMGIYIAAIVLMVVYLLDNRPVHESVFLGDVEEVVVFQEYYKAESGGVSVEHLNSRLDAAADEARQLVEWFNSVDEEDVVVEGEVPDALAGVSFEMRKRDDVVVYYHEGIFYVSDGEKAYSFVHDEMGAYFDERLKESEADFGH